MTVLNERERLRTILLVFPMIALVACGGGGGGSSSGGGPGPDPEPGPAALIASEPASDAAEVPVNSALRAVFADPVETASVTVSAPGGAIPGTVTWTDNTVLFVPSADFSPSTLYTATIVLTVPGQAPAGGTKSCSWTFTTGPMPAVRGRLLPDNIALLPLDGVEVRSEDRAVLAGAAGRFSFATLPLGKHLLVAEKTFSSGAIRRILGVATANVAGSPITVDIRMGDFTDGYTFCMGCHPPWGSVLQPGQIVRCVAMPPTYPVPCETCHTLHREVGFGRFLWGGDADICNQCHGSA